MLIWAILLLASLPLLVEPIGPHGAQALEHTVSPERWAVCPVEVKQLYELDASYPQAQSDPVPPEVTFPSPASRSDRPGAPYQFIAGDRVEGYRGDSTIVIDGTRVVAGGIFSGHVLDDMAELSLPELASVEKFLSLWSDCSIEPIPQQFAGLITNFGLRWIFSKGDPFAVQTTPLSVVRSDNIAHAKGALPLLIVDTRKLSDGRVMVVVGEGVGVGDTGFMLLPEAMPGSI